MKIISRLRDLKYPEFASHINQVGRQKGNIMDGRRVHYKIILINIPPVGLPFFLRNKTIKGIIHNAYMARVPILFLCYAISLVSVMTQMLYPNAPNIGAYNCEPSLDPSLYPKIQLMFIAKTASRRFKYNDHLGLMLSCMTPTNELVELYENERIRNRIRHATRSSLEEQTGVSGYTWKTLESLSVAIQILYIY